MVDLRDCVGLAWLVLPAFVYYLVLSIQWHGSSRGGRSQFLSGADRGMGDLIGARHLGCGAFVLVANNAGNPQELQACRPRCLEVPWRALR